MNFRIVSDTLPQIRRFTVDWFEFKQVRNGRFMYNIVEIQQNLVLQQIFDEYIIKCSLKISSTLYDYQNF